MSNSSLTVLLDKPRGFSAHGVPKAVAAGAEHRNLDYIDATCPLVPEDAAAPAVLAQEVLAAFRARSVVTVEAVKGPHEDMRFNLPRALTP